MSDHEARKSDELLGSVMRGAGLGGGFVGVLAAASLLRTGPRNTAKGTMRLMLRCRATIAETSEQIRDLYAEAREEHAQEGVSPAEAPPD